MSRSECEERMDRVVLLPPLPATERETATVLFTHLTMTGDKPCKRELGMGGEPDVSFDKAAAQFGCEVRSHGPDRPPPQRRVYHRTSPLSLELDQLPGNQHRPISLLALELDAAALARFLERPPEALARRVEQLTVRLNLTAVLVPDGRSGKLQDAARKLRRRLYTGLLGLQERGFHLFSATAVENSNGQDVTVAGVAEAVPSLTEVAWMKVLC
ncbi:uncharacterized protein LOC119104247 isoform X3 [Pollicipes pollicipes]|uniref:uncharacterized protein LOC119104247 isoform X3 n=1 Tax=Pollicipes pollicipes TaxID=41117 RepID=UPI001884E9EB|nr:uncharacterized protein LOC119104247 isoform X3 [Pollicipes pollicipes]